jgi:hypothetical protein
MLREILAGLGIIGTKKVGGKELSVYWHDVPKAIFLPPTRKHIYDNEVGPGDLIVISPVDSREERPAGRTKLSWWR